MKAYAVLAVRLIVIGFALACAPLPVAAMPAAPAAGGAQLTVVSVLPKPDLVVGIRLRHPVAKQAVVLRLGSGVAAASAVPAGQSIVAYEWQGQFLTQTKRFLAGHRYCAVTTYTDEGGLATKWFSRRASRGPDNVPDARCLALARQLLR